MTRLRPTLFGGAALTVMALGQAAHAQAADDQADGADIVVTAQLRSQSLQDVPIAVQVVSADQIAQFAADDISDLAAFVPGLEVSASSPTQPRYAVRGISTSDFGVGTDPAVGVYIDGVYSGRSGAAVLSFNDVERIEVLKGPQGTLFGRNAAAGAVSVVTRKPSDRTEASLSARAGNYGKYRAEAMLNLPLGEDLSLRVNGLYNKRNGIYVDAASGEKLSREKNWAARAQLAWRPGEVTEVIASWVHDGLDQDARPAIGIVTIPDYPAFPEPDPSPSSYINPFTAPLRNDTIGLAERRNLDEFSLRITQDFGAIKLSSITSYREFTTNNREDEDGTNRIDLYFDTNNREENESFYQELRLSSAGDKVDWLVGASYFKEEANQISDTFAFTDSINTTLGNVGFGTPFSDLENFVIIPNDIPTTLLGLGWREAIFNRGDYEAYALFGDAIWHATDRLNLTVGMRYTRDKKRFSWLNGPREAPELDEAIALLDAIGVLGALELTPADLTFDIVFDMNNFGGISCDNGVQVAEGVTCQLKDTFSDFSPRVVVDYELNDDVMVYASFAQGYKAGGYNSVQPASRFTNEDIDNYEAGFKANFRDAGLIFNASGFRYIYKNRQSIRLVVPAGTVIPQYVTDTSDEQAWGLDLATSWSPRDTGLRLWGNLQYIDATFKKRVNAQGQNLAGAPNGTPSWSFSLGGDYSFDLGQAGSLDFQVAHAYTGPCRPNVESLAQGTCGGSLGAFTLGQAHNRTDLRLQWNSDNERIAIGVYANNVFDNRYVDGVNNITAATLGTPFAQLSQPRFYGADIRLKY
jgi:iron complex outermembrane receptor protein